MGLQGVKQVLQKCPPLFRAARAIQSAGRTVFGPAWLKRQVEQRRAQGAPIRIVIGSSHVFDNGWIPTNVQYLNLLVDEHWQQALGNCLVDAMLAEHVWEHLTLADGEAAAAQCFRHLRPGGYLRIAVPDGHHPDPQYIEFVRPGCYGAGEGDHKTLYTIESITEMLTNVGFEVLPLEYYDAAGEFHKMGWDQMDGRVYRCHGWSESNRIGGKMEFTSLIVDARVPAN